MQKELTSLQEIALNVRETILRMSSAGGCFTGASLSCTDLIVYLYARFLNVHPLNLQSPGRDYFFLSKGHDVPALYGTLVQLGLMNKERLLHHLSVKENIYWHPNTNIPFVEFHSGSLGHLPSVALGVAFDCKQENTGNKILVMVGDGELNEGSVWEAILVGNAKKLNNLTMIIDRNNFQANIATEDLIPLEPLTDKFRAFGCEVKRINGHDFADIDGAFSALPFSDDKVNVIIADTVRGKGVPSIEARADRWFCNFTQEEMTGLIDELQGRSGALLISEPLIVR
jgi:transketolase